MVKLPLRAVSSRPLIRPKKPPVIADHVKFNPSDISSLLFWLDGSRSGDFTVNGSDEVTAFTDQISGLELTAENTSKFEYDSSTEALKIPSGVAAEYLLEADNERIYTSSEDVTYITRIYIPEEFAITTSDVSAFNLYIHDSQYSGDGHRVGLDRVQVGSDWYPAFIFRTRNLNNGSPGINKTVDLAALAAPGSWHTLSCRSWYDSDSEWYRWDIRIDSDAASVYTQDDAFSSGNWGAGQLEDEDPETFFFGLTFSGLADAEIQISDFMIFDAYLTDTQIGQVEKYLAQKNPTPDPSFLPSSLSGYVTAFDATENLTIDSENRVTSWDDISSNLTLTGAASDSDKAKYYPQHQAIGLTDAITLEVDSTEGRLNLTGALEVSGNAVTYFMRVRLFEQLEDYTQHLFINSDGEEDGGHHECRVTYSAGFPPFTPENNTQQYRVQTDDGAVSMKSVYSRGTTSSDTAFDRFITQAIRIEQFDGDLIATIFINGELDSRTTVDSSADLVSIAQGDNDYFYLLSKDSRALISHFAVFDEAVPVEDLKKLHWWATR